jgi:hypothetical protein
MCRGGGDCQPEPVPYIAGAMSDAERKARLAEQLRANLRKRKARAREVGADHSSPNADDSAYPDPK